MTGLLDTTLPAVHCPGCGHPHVLKALDEALGAAGIPRQRIALVSDIGCVGLADPYFPTLHTVHTLHGRSAAVAAGLALGDPERSGTPLKPVVLVGDGGATIGLLHLVHAAQMDVGITVVLHNNLVYGMTGGQHSGLTPEGLATTTTPAGSPFPPLDLGRILEGAGCGFFARTRAPGNDLVPILAEAIRHPGFSCVEVLELCPTFAARVGGVTGKGLDAMLSDAPPGEPGRHGILHRRAARRAPDPTEAPAEEDPLESGVAPDPSWRRLSRTARAVVAGRAGERVQSAARLAAAAAAAAGLHVTVRTDNPVTQGRGFSLAEVTFSPDPIAWPGLVDPDVVCVTAPEGLAELQGRGLFRPPSGRAGWSSTPPSRPPREFPPRRWTSGGATGSTARPSAGWRRRSHAPAGGLATRGRRPSSRSGAPRGRRPPVRWTSPAPETPGGGPSMPYVFAVLAGLCWGVGEVFTRAVLRTKEVGPFAAIAVRTTVALPILWAVWAAVSRVSGGPDAALLGAASRSTLWRLLLGSGLLAGAAGMAFFYAALSGAEICRVKPIAFGLAPATAVLLGWLVLGESMTGAKAAGLVCVVAGILLLTCSH